MSTTESTPSTFKPKKSVALSCVEAATTAIYTHLTASGKEKARQTLDQIMNDLP